MIELIHLIANDISKICPPDGPQGLNCGLSNARANHAALQNILQIVFGIIGAIALLMIVLAGLRYITSAGDPQKAAGAKNTIILALVGLVIAMTAEAIVTYVVKGVS